MDQYFFGVYETVYGDYGFASYGSADTEEQAEELAENSGLKDWFVLHRNELGPFMIQLNGGIDVYYIMRKDKCDAP